MAPAQHPGKARSRRIRVLLLEITGIVADLVRQTVSEQPDLELIASVPALHELDTMAGNMKVDLVITTYPPNPSDLRRFHPMLAARPGLRVLAIKDDSRSACMYTLAPTTTDLGVLTPETLIQFIRAPESPS